MCLRTSITAILDFEARLRTLQPAPSDALRFRSLGPKAKTLEIGKDSNLADQVRPNSDLWLDPTARDLVT